MGYDIQSEHEFDMWGRVCGCSYNVDSQTMQWNSFRHPTYCFPQEDGSTTQHNNAQDNDALTNGFQPVCWNDALTTDMYYLVKGDDDEDCTEPSGSCDTVP